MPGKQHQTQKVSAACSANDLGQLLQVHVRLRQQDEVDVVAVKPKAQGLRAKDDPRIVRPATPLHQFLGLVLEAAVDRAGTAKVPDHPRGAVMPGRQPLGLDLKVREHHGLHDPPVFPLRRDPSGDRDEHGPAKQSLDDAGEVSRQRHQHDRMQQVGPVRLPSQEPDPRFGKVEVFSNLGDDVVRDRRARQTHRH